MSKIEKNVPLPPMHQRLNSRRYPWHEMEIGDSVFFSGDKQPTLAGSASGYGQRSGKKFTTRRVSEDGKVGTRVWRIV